MDDWDNNCWHNAKEEEEDPEEVEVPLHRTSDGGRDDAPNRSNALRETRSCFYRPKSVDGHRVMLQFLLHDDKFH